MLSAKSPEAYASFYSVHSERSTAPSAGRSAKLRLRLERSAESRAAQEPRLCPERLVSLRCLEHLGRLDVTLVERSNHAEASRRSLVELHSALCYIPTVALGVHNESLPI